MGMGRIHTARKPVGSGSLARSTAEHSPSIGQMKASPYLNANIGNTSPAAYDETTTLPLNIRPKSNDSGNEEFFDTKPVHDVLDAYDGRQAPIVPPKPRKDSTAASAPAATAPAATAATASAATASAVPAAKTTAPLSTAAPAPTTVESRHSTGWQDPQRSGTRPASKPPLNRSETNASRASSFASTTASLTSPSEVTFGSLDAVPHMPAAPLNASQTSFQTSSIQRTNSQDSTAYASSWQYPAYGQTSQTQLQPQTSQTQTGQPHTGQPHTGDYADAYMQYAQAYDYNSPEYNQLYHQYYSQGGYAYDPQMYDPQTYAQYGNYAGYTQWADPSGAAHAGMSYPNNSDQAIGPKEIVPTASQGTESLSSGYSQVSLPQTARVSKEEDGGSVAASTASAAASADTYSKRASQESSSSTHRTRPPLKLDASQLSSDASLQVVDTPASQISQAAILDSPLSKQMSSSSLRSRPVSNSSDSVAVPPVPAPGAANDNQRSLDRHSFDRQSVKSVNAPASNSIIEEPEQEKDAMLGIGMGSAYVQRMRVDAGETHISRQPMNLPIGLRRAAKSAPINVKPEFLRRAMDIRYTHLPRRMLETEVDDDDDLETETDAKTETNAAALESISRPSVTDSTDSPRNSVAETSHRSSSPVDSIIERTGKIKLFVANPDDD